MLKKVTKTAETFSRNWINFRTLEVQNFKANPSEKNHWLQGPPCKIYLNIRFKHIKNLINNLMVFKCCLRNDFHFQIVYWKILCCKSSEKSKRKLEKLNLSIRCISKENISKIKLKFIATKTNNIEICIYLS
jgi:hypothetical protein